MITFCFNELKKFSTSAVTDKETSQTTSDSTSASTSTSWTTSWTTSATTSRNTTTTFSTSRNTSRSTSRNTTTTFTSTITRYNDPSDSWYSGLTGCGTGGQFAFYSNINLSGFQMVQVVWDDAEVFCCRDGEGSGFFQGGSFDGLEPDDVTSVTGNDGCTYLRGSCCCGNPRGSAYTADSSCSLEYYFRHQRERFSVSKICTNASRNTTTTFNTTFSTSFNTTRTTSTSWTTSFNTSVTTSRNTTTAFNTSWTTSWTTSFNTTRTTTFYKDVCF